MMVIDEVAIGESEGDGFRAANGTLKHKSSLPASVRMPPKNNLR